MHSSMTIDTVSPRSPRWPAGVGTFTTTRSSPSGGRAAMPGPYGSFNLAAHVGDDDMVVEVNRRSLRDHAEVAAIQWLDQVHGARCVAAGLDTVEQVPRADAAWTDVPGVALAVLTADCLPVVVCDEDASVVAVAHGGWRGLVGGVIGSMVAALPVPPDRLMAWLGPAIGPDAYEVGEDVHQAVRNAPEGAALCRGCLRPAAASGKYWLDLFSLGEQLLEAAGVGRVESERLCTWHDGRFYSYRREGITGRMATLAWLRRAR